MKDKKFFLNRTREEGVEIFQADGTARVKGDNRKEQNAGRT